MVPWCPVGCYWTDFVSPWQQESIAAELLEVAVLMFTKKENSCSLLRKEGILYHLIAHISEVLIYSDKHIAEIGILPLPCTIENKKR